MSLSFNGETFREYRAKNHLDKPATTSVEVPMRLESTDPTSATLLGRVGLGPGDHVAWARFVNLYGSRIRGWCRRWGLQEADSEDVTQDVLLRLSQKLGAFQYDPSRSFRGWLRTVTQHVDGTSSEPRRSEIVTADRRDLFGRNHGSTRRCPHRFAVRPDRDAQRPGCAGGDSRRAQGPGAGTRSHAG